MVITPINEIIRRPKVLVNGQYSYTVSIRIPSVFVDLKYSNTLSVPSVLVYRRYTNTVRIRIPSVFVDLKYSYPNFTNIKHAIKDSNNKQKS